MVLTATNNSAELVNQILSEGILSMSALARMFGELRGGRPTHPSTVTRWHKKGIQLPDGSILKLEGVVLNGKPVSSRQALLRFISAQQPNDADTTPIRTPKKRRRDSERSSQELAAAGA